MEFSSFIELVQQKHGHKFKGHKLYSAYTNGLACKRNGKVVNFSHEYEDVSLRLNRKVISCINERSFEFGLEEKTSGIKHSFMRISHNMTSSGSILYKAKQYKNAKRYMFSAITQELKLLNEPLEVSGVYNANIQNSFYYKVETENKRIVDVKDLNSFADNNKNFVVLEKVLVGQIELIKSSLTKIVYKDDMKIFDRQKRK